MPDKVSMFLPIPGTPNWWKAIYGLTEDEMSLVRVMVSKNKDEDRDDVWGAACSSLMLGRTGTPPINNLPFGYLPLTFVEEKLGKGQLAAWLAKKGISQSAWKNWTFHQEQMPREIRHALEDEIRDSFAKACLAS